jgi:hypothetical protein
MLKTRYSQRRKKSFSERENYFFQGEDKRFYERVRRWANAIPNMLKT